MDVVQHSSLGLAGGPSRRTISAVKSGGEEAEDVGSHADEDPTVKKAESKNVSQHGFDAIWLHHPCDRPWPGRRCLVGVFPKITSHGKVIF